MKPKLFLRFNQLIILISHQLINFPLYLFVPIKQYQHIHDHFRYVSEGIDNSDKRRLEPCTPTDLHQKDLCHKYFGMSNLFRLYLYHVPRLLCMFWFVVKGTRICVAVTKILAYTSESFSNSDRNTGRTFLQKTSSRNVDILFVLRYSTR